MLNTETTQLSLHLNYVTVNTSVTEPWAHLSPPSGSRGEYKNTVDAGDV